jgi:hypothetical protein
MRRRLTARYATLALAACGPAAVLAQQVEALPSAASRCLQPRADARGEPEYPFAAWKNNEKGRVKVELEFTIPDGRPRVQVLEREGPSSLVDAVESHLRSYRVPCLTAAETPARLQIEFVFRPDDRRVLWAQPLDADAAERGKSLACVRHASGDKAPAYPLAALRAELQGRVLAKLRFVAPDQPPVAEIHARPSARPLADAVERWVAGYRMPCLEGSPAEGLWSFVYRLEGDAFGLKPLDLLQFMGSVVGIDKQHVNVDTTAMGCPFDLRLSYRQPVMPNGVGEIGSRDPARRPLIEWLQAARLNLSRRAEDAVFADSTTINVPCAKIDLKPKEKS